MPLAYGGLHVRRSLFDEHQRGESGPLVHVPHHEAGNAVHVAVCAVGLHGVEVDINERSLARLGPQFFRGTAIVGAGIATQQVKWDLGIVIHERGMNPEAVLLPRRNEFAGLPLEHPLRGDEILLPELGDFPHDLAIRNHPLNAAENRMVVKIGEVRGNRVAVGVDIEPEPGPASGFHTANADNGARTACGDVLEQFGMRLGTAVVRVDGRLRNIRHERVEGGVFRRGLHAGNIGNVVFVSFRLARIRKTGITFRNRPDVGRRDGVGASGGVSGMVRNKFNRAVAPDAPAHNQIVHGIAGRCFDGLVHHTVRSIQPMRVPVGVVVRNGRLNLFRACAAAGHAPMRVGVVFVLRQPGQGLAHVAGKLFLRGLQRGSSFIEFFKYILRSRSRGDGGSFVVSHNLSFF